MTELAERGAYGVLVEPATLQIRRHLPGPIERVWSYLTDSDLRRQWLAAGVMEGKAGSPVELVWRNDELTDPPGQRPEGFGEEHRMTSTVTVFDPPHRLSFTWGAAGEVTFDLRPSGDEVLLTMTHARLTDRNQMLMVSAGWHSHLDILAAKLTGAVPEPHWEHWLRLKQDYEKRLG